MSRLAAVALVIALLVAGAGCATTDTPRPVSLAWLTVDDAARLIRTGKITSVELTRHYLVRAEANPELNTFITLDREGAMAAATRADAERAASRLRGPLHGVPIVVKDNIHVAGLPNTAGTPALRGFVPRDNAPVVQKLVDAGAIVLGKTNMHELAFGISGYNEAFATGNTIGVRNPYDRTRFAGGSSSGTAAAIAADLAPGGLGSDTGGSSRIPAAVTGGAGFRPTVGRYSGDAITPISHTRDTAGPMARTVADVALLDAVLTGGTPVQPASLLGVKLGMYRAHFFANLDADTRAVAASALVQLTAAGVTLVEVDMPDLQRLNNAVSFPVALYEAHDDLRAYLAKHGTGLTVEQVARQIASKDVKATYDTLVVPRKLPAPNGVVDAAPVYQAAVRDYRPALEKYYADTFTRYGIEALIFPTTPHVAAVQGPAASSLETFLLFIQNTDPGSNAGIPGLSIPAGLGPSGLPVGIEIDGPRGSDARLLAIGLAIERVLGRTSPPRL
jgi:Asp-tRNA(Asn)/Glu-tRNA(Gln) amidotransferase A subunit family amidase